MSRFDLAYRIAYTDAFLRDQRRFASEHAVLADLALTVGELSRQPFKNPALESHRVKGGQAGLMTSYVGRQQHRVIWFKADQTAVLLVFDRHDEAYRRATRLRVGFDGESGVQVLEQQATEPDPIAATTRSSSSTGPAPFDPWDDALLADAGFAAHEINLLRDVRDEDGVLELQRYLRPEAFELALRVALASSEDEVRELASPLADASEPTPDEERFGQEIQERLTVGEQTRVAVVAPEDIERMLTRPIEDWMVFLHPEQRALVERRFNGPARITGGAGTGKTVVGVHRAVRLADEGRDVLFTTYIRTLPKVLETVCERLSPETAQRITFSGVHAYALGVARKSGLRLDGQQVKGAFDDAWRKVAAAGSRLRELGLGKQYFRDEIAWIIKGRGLTPDERETYMSSPRTGRGTPFPASVREEIWKLFELYERRLRARNTVDFDDVLRLARDHVRAHGDPSGFDVVIVDEAQDLTQVGLELLAAIPGSREDGLLLLGDGQQSLYPGGHSLGAVGIDVRGRAAVLRLNYRNTREILAAANRIVAGRPFDDGDEDLQRIDPIDRLDMARSGLPPSLRRFASVDDHDQELTVAIHELAGRDDTDLGDIAILVPTNSLARTYAAIITDLGLACQPLDRYEGTPSSDVKVGTFKRAKGLEFKHVLIPRAEPGMLREAPLPGEDAATHDERLDRTRRELFVAVTRARDSVWVGHVGAPTALLGVAGPPQGASNIRSRR